MKRGIIIACLLIGNLILLSSHVMAQGGKIRIGKIMIFPRITVQALHDDNIYLSEGTADDPELSDWITHVMPAFGLDYTFPERGSLTLLYEGDLAYYSDYDENDWQTHIAKFDLNYKAPGGLILGITNIYADAEDPYGNDAEYKLGVPKTERWHDYLKTRIGYAFANRLNVFAFYNYFKQDYELEEDFDQDYDANEFGVGFQMRLLPKTWGFVRYHYGKRDYFTHPVGTGVTEANDADSDWHRINAGLTWDTGAKLSGELNFGYQWKDYENEFDPDGIRYDDKDTWIAGTEVSFTKNALECSGLWPEMKSAKAAFPQCFIGLFL